MLWRRMDPYARCSPVRLSFVHWCKWDIQHESHVDLCCSALALDGRSIQLPQNGWRCRWEHHFAYWSSVLSNNNSRGALIDESLCWMLTRLCFQEATDWYGLNIDLTNIVGDTALCIAASQNVRNCGGIVRVRNYLFLLLRESLVWCRIW